MDTSELLCLFFKHKSIVIDTCSFLQWPNRAMLNQHHFEKEQDYISPYKRLNVLARSTKDLDEIDRQAYHGIEKQDKKIASRILQGLEAILSAVVSLVRGLESGQTHRALSPCNGNAHNVLTLSLVSTTYITLRQVIDPGVSSVHTHYCCGSEGVRVFSFFSSKFRGSSGMYKVLVKVQRLHNSLNYISFQLKCQDCSHSIRNEI